MLEQFWRPPSGCVNGACDARHYAVSDVFYVEACMISFICKNRERLWQLNVGEDFFCELDDSAWDDFKKAAV